MSNTARRAPQEIRIDLAVFSGSQLVFLVLTDGEVVGLLGFQCIKHQVYRVFELLVILPDLHGVDELDEGREILLLYRGLIVDIPNQRAIQQGLCFDPKNRLRLFLRLWYWRSAL